MANSSKDKQKNIAKHVAIIMDGNGRWAISNSLNISKGHSKGVEIVRDIVEESVKQNIASLTLYAFSSENWSRPKSEIDAIKKLVVKAINEQVPDLKKQKVKLKFFGEIEDFGSKILSKIYEAETATSEYESVLDLNVALGYGGRQDIVNLTKKISSKVKDGLIALEEIDEKMISGFSSSPVEDIDLLIRTGRANPAILDDIKVDYYGNLTVLTQTASISVEDGRSLVISPWDKSLIPEIEKAISNSNLGLNPSTSSDLIRITMPALTEETRQDYIKQARAEAENSRVSIRNIRRDANQASKELQSSGEISEDDLRRIEDLIQKETDKYIGLVDSELKAKESDLLEI